LLEIVIKHRFEDIKKNDEFVKSLTLKVVYVRLHY